MWGELFLFDEVFLVVVDEQGGHGKGDDHAENAQQRATLPSSKSKPPAMVVS